jgi:hypothetical protein
MKLQPTLEKRLAKYGAMSLTLATVSAPQAAKAGIISYLSSGDCNPALSSPCSDGDGGIYFNALQGTVDTSPVAGDYELLLDAGPLARFEVYENSMLNASSKRFFAAAFGFTTISSSHKLSSAARLPFGASIGSALKFSNLNGTLAEMVTHSSIGDQPFGHFNPVSGDLSGYLGLEVFHDGTPEYGWADIVVHPNYSVTLDAFALQTDGDSIDAGDSGATPESASILLLTLGAAGLAAYRRKLVSPGG